MIQLVCKIQRSFLKTPGNPLGTPLIGGISCWKYKYKWVVLCDVDGLWQEIIWYL